LHIPIWTRLWLRCTGVAGALGLSAYLLFTDGLWESPRLVAIPLYALALPGLLLSVVLGASPHGGGFGDARDFIVIPVGSGVVWGTLLFGLLLIVRGRHSDAAA